MKNYCLSILLICFCTSFSTSLYAQSKSLSKSEKKEIKQKLKAFMKKPETYKSMVTNYDNSIKDRDTKMEEQELEISRWKQKYKVEISECNDSLMAVRSRLAAATAAPATAQGNTLPAGVSYGVQCGNYKFFDITKYFGTDKYLIAFFDNETHQYVISYFKDVMTADACRQDIRKLGIKDAFITKYVDGKRVAFDSKKEKE